MSQLNNSPTNYITNSYNNSDLAKIIPPIQYAYILITGNGSNATGTISINNYNGTTNYFVLTSFLSNYGGGSDTYNPGGTVTALGVPIIFNKTTTSFQYQINKATGDFMNVYACFTIIYV